MRLIGILLSPFVRRVAVSLALLKLPFELDEVFVFAEPEVIRRHNPLVRIPVLTLDSGENLVESGAILDEIDHMVSPSQRLVPAEGPLRRRVMQLTAMAMGSAEKAQWALYEERVRPPEKVHAPWTEHNEAQVIGGLQYLNDTIAKVGETGWIAGTSQISQADVTTAVTYTFTALVRPHLRLAERFPQLARFTARCESLPAFSSAPIPPASRLQGLMSQPFIR